VHGDLAADVEVHHGVVGKPDIALLVDLGDEHLRGRRSGAESAESYGHQRDEQGSGKRGWDRPAARRGRSRLTMSLVGERHQLRIVFDELIEAAHRCFGVHVSARVSRAHRKPSLEFGAITPGEVRRMDTRIPTGRVIHQGLAGFAHEVHLA
jgi:hypothetical protein